MHKLQLTLACGRYDRTQPLIDGRVQVEGVDLTFLPLRPGETFWRMLNHGEFDVSEMSLSSYTILRSTLEAMLQRGEIDALISVMIPSGFGKTVRRLFRDSRKVEIEYYRKTRIFPIMHTLVLKSDLYNEKPWLAVSFYHAFCRARDIAQQSMYDTDALTVSLPWIIDEMEGTRRLFGPQVWDYSVEGSLPTLNALLAYLNEQKLSKRRMSVDELFVPNISPGL